MKRLWIITLTILVVMLGAVTVWRLWPAKPPTDSLYGIYSQRTDVRVGLVRDFVLDDSLKVDVVTIEAHDSAGWSWMQQEFGIQEPADEPIDADRRLLAWQDHDNRYIFCMPGKRALCIIEPADGRQLKAIVNYHLNLISK